MTFTKYNLYNIPSQTIFLRKNCRTFWEKSKWNSPKKWDVFNFSPFSRFFFRSFGLYGLNFSEAFREVWSTWDIYPFLIFSHLSSVWWVLPGRWGEYRGWGRHTTTEPSWTCHFHLYLHPEPFLSFNCHLWNLSNLIQCNGDGDITDFNNGDSSDDSSDDSSYSEL